MFFFLKKALLANIAHTKVDTPHCANYKMFTFPRKLNKNVKKSHNNSEIKLVKKNKKRNYKGVLKKVCFSIVISVIYFLCSAEMIDKYIYIYIDTFFGGF